MLDALPNLTLEILASGIVGLIMLGVVVRNAMLGWLEASLKLKQNNKEAINSVTTMGLTWDRDQVERALQLIDRVGQALEIQNKHIEAIARAQGILSDNFQKTTHERLNDILSRLDEAESKSNKTRRRRPKSTS